MRLLAASLTLLVIPYAGYRYVSEMEAFLRVGFEQSLLGGARALAGALHGRSSLFPADTGDAPDFTRIRCHPLFSWTVIRLSGAAYPIYTENLTGRHQPRTPRLHGCL